MKKTRETDTGVDLIRRAMMFLAVALVVTVVVVAGLLLIGEVRWDEVVGFVEWFSRSTAFGAIIAGTLALTAAWLAYHGVQQTIRSTETREREKARHERFTTIVTQLASNQPAVRLGGLYAVSALADEWEREARRLIFASDSASEWRDKERAWASAVERLSATGLKLFQWESERHARTDERSPDEGLIRQLAEAKREVATARLAYMLTWDAVPLPAKDAVTYRDSCLEMINAYLRAGPRPPQSRTDISEQQKKTSAHSSTGPGGNAEALAAAAVIVRRHTLLDAPYPWPPQQINLSHAYLKGADLSETHLQRVNLSEAMLHHANLREAHLEGANLTSAKLADSSMFDTHLEGASLRFARMERANLSGAYLERADLKGAYLSETRMDRTRLEGAILH